MDFPPDKMKYIVQNLPVQMYKEKDMHDAMPRWAVVLKEHSRAQLFNVYLWKLSGCRPARLWAKLRACV